MVLTSEQERVRDLLRETVTCLCKRGLSFQSSFRIEGLLGITVDEQEVFLINLNETVGCGKSPGPASSPANTEEQVAAETEASPVSPNAPSAVPPRAKRKRTPRRKAPSINSDQSPPDSMSSNLLLPTSASLDVQGGGAFGAGIQTVGGLQAAGELQTVGNLWDAGSVCESESIDSCGTPAKRPYLSSSDTDPCLTVIKPEPLSDTEDYNDNKLHYSSQAVEEDAASDSSRGMSLPVVLNAVGSVTTVWEDSQDTKPPRIFSQNASTQEILKGLVAQIRVTQETGIELPEELKKYVFTLSQGRPSKYVRKLVHILFPNTEELANSSCLGLKTGHHPAQALDSHRVEIIKEATMSFYPKLLHKEFIHIMNECCRDARAKIKRLSQQLEWHHNHGTQRTSSPLNTAQ